MRWLTRANPLTQLKYTAALGTIPQYGQEAFLGNDDKERVRMRL